MLSISFRVNNNVPPSHTDPGSRYLSEFSFYCSWFSLHPRHPGLIDVLWINWQTPFLVVHTGCSLFLEWFSQITTWSLSHSPQLFAYLPLFNEVYLNHHILICNLTLPLLSALLIPFSPLSLPQHLSSSKILPTL